MDKVEKGGGVALLGRQRAFQLTGGFLEPLLLFEQQAQVVARRTEPGIEGDHLLQFLHGLLAPAQPEQAQCQVVVRRLGTRVERERLPEVRDRPGDISKLSRSDAQINVSCHQPRIQPRGSLETLPSLGCPARAQQGHALGHCALGRGRPLGPRRKAGEQHEQKPAAELWLRHALL